MNDALFPHYLHELLFVRQLTQEFTSRFPRAAGRLRLQPHGSADPQVERLLQSFALLAGRLQHRLDDEFPEVSEALLQVLYPHFLAPIPSMAIAHFELDPSRAQPGGVVIPQHSELHTAPVDSVRCRYRTTYPLTLWPVKVASARFQAPPFPAGLDAPSHAAAVLRLHFECVGGLTFSELELDRLRLFLHGDSQVIPPLYEMLFNHALQVVFRPVDAAKRSAPLVLAPQSCLAQVGFERGESLLPYPERSRLGYRLLTEFFTFPAKFWFVDLGGWQRARHSAGQKACEVIIFFDKTLKSLEKSVDAATFRLGCAPIVNLSEHTTAPIPLVPGTYEYRVIPDLAHPRSLEVYSVDGLNSVDPATGETTEYPPFYSFRHEPSPDRRPVCWYTSRQPALAANDRGSDVWLHLVDLDFEPRLPAKESLTVHTTCTNRDLPSQQGSGPVAFELAAAAPVPRIESLGTPTPPLRPPARRGRFWGLISHLSLNHLSLSDPREGREALQDILRLYDFSDPEAGQREVGEITRQYIEGITAVNSRRVIGRLAGETISAFCRGLEVTLDFDEEKCAASGVLLFASVLERFLGLYTSINSFSQLVARTEHGEIRRWPPRPGELQGL